MRDEPGQNVIRMGPIEAILDDGFVRLDGRAVILTEHEFKLLVTLMRWSGQVVRREQLYRDVWDDSLRPGDRSVDVYVFKLRGKLEQALPGWAFIHTHFGWGYRLEPEWRGSSDPVPVTSRSRVAAGSRGVDSEISRRRRRSSNHETRRSN
jgi:DNA-binding response OmpR family regulator